MRNTILIADSSEANREILEELFEEDFEVKSVEDGQKALEIILKEHNTIAAVVIDYNLPVKSATDVLGGIAKQPWYENLPVVVLSEDTSLKIEKSIYKLGAVDFLRKPFDSSLVSRKVRKYAELYSVKEELDEAKKTIAGAGDTGRIATGDITNASIASFERMHMTMIELIGTLVEFRNPENQNHVQRMRGLVKIMARSYQQLYPEVNLTESVIEDITTACSIHDIGKIAIPDTILLKPGRLTDEEYEYMKSHPLRGIDLLDTVKGAWDDSFDQIARQVVRSHHEKFDGGGYPDGLKGDAIPISAQIVSICDTYDALVNDRVYKKAFPKDVAFNMIIVGDCGIFPPKILECFKVAREQMEAWENGELTIENL